MKPPVEFDEPTHTYRVAGIVKTTVTTIFKDMGIISFPATLDASRLAYLARRGTAIHKCCQYLSEGTLDWSSVSPSILAKVKAFDRFLQDTGFVPEWMERPLWSAQYDYCGTPDLVGMLGGRRTVIDIKSGIVMGWHPMQSAAYRQLVEENDAAPIESRAGLYLRNSGYDLHPHTDIEDWPRFSSILADHKTRFGGTNGQ